MVRCVVALPLCTYCAGLMRVLNFKNASGKCCTKDPVWVKPEELMRQLTSDRPEGGSFHGEFLHMCKFEVYDVECVAICGDLSLILLFSRDYIVSVF